MADAQVMPGLRPALNPLPTNDRYRALTRDERCDLADTHEALAVSAAEAGAWERCGWHERQARAVWAGASG